MKYEIGPAESHGISHPKKCAMLTALAKTGNVAAAARAIGVARRTHYDWAASDPDYVLASRQAMEEAADVLEAIARKRAIVGSDTLLIFLLKSVRPEKFTQRVAVSCEATEPSPPRTVEDAQRELNNRINGLAAPVARRLIRALEDSLRRRHVTIDGVFEVAEES